MSNGKDMITVLIVGLINWPCIKISQYFPKPFNSHFGGTLKVNIDLSNYATKTDLTYVTHIDTSSFALKTNLPKLKTEVDKLDIDKLVPIPAALSKLSIVVKNDVAKKGKTELKNKIPDVTDFVKKVKLTELENKIPDISNLATKTALTTVENKIPDVSNLATKTALTTHEKKNTWY